MTTEVERSGKMLGKAQAIMEAALILGLLPKVTQEMRTWIAEMENWLGTV